LTAAQIRIQNEVGDVKMMAGEGRYNNREKNNIPVPHARERNQ
jgi:hypothetical protein